MGLHTATYDRTTPTTMRHNTSHLKGRYFEQSRKSEDTQGSLRGISGKENKVWRYNIVVTIALYTYFVGLIRQACQAAPNAADLNIKILLRHCLVEEVLPV